MRKLFIALLYVLVLADGTTGWAADDTLERLLRAQAFNREFEGFDSYYVMIEADHLQPDGSHEVLAVASGKFSDNTKRMKKRRQEKMQSRKLQNMRLKYRIK